ncbi:MAG: BlaI/MecI/CopY family transcriptional regulator [Bacteroidia bacterium]|nr:BlaI/MecI/CopY family transcriptional regulator [Bacteroidia bacterium]
MTKPTNGELEILRILWDHGPSTVRFINDQLSTDKEVGYTTTLKLMQIMYEKGLLERSRDGKTHIYLALVSEEDTQRQLLDRFLDTAFQGSAMKLVMQALGNHHTTTEELDEIRRFLDDLEKNQQKGV